MEPPRKATKAIVAGLVAAAGQVATMFADGGVTVPEVAIGVASTVLAVGAVYGVTNAPKP